MSLSGGSEDHDVAMEPELKRVKLETGSPAPSCLSMRSDSSLKQPISFRDGFFTQEDRVKLETGSPAPSCLSMRSDSSLKQPISFRDGYFTQEDSKLSASLPREEMCTCSLCKTLLKDPVSIPCGHNYCRQCIQGYWDQPYDSGGYPCPQCGKIFDSLPILYPSTTLDQLLQKFQTPLLSSALHGHDCARPGDVACDFCTGRKLKAVKQCLTCMASYCEKHVQQHYTVPAMQYHRLVEVTGSLKFRLCQHHNRALEVFCKTDQTLICTLCAIEEHRSHDIVVAKTEQELKQVLNTAEKQLADNVENPISGGFQEPERAGCLQTLEDKHKDALKRKFEVVPEEIAQPGEQTLLDDIFTHVWITEGSCVEVNRGHEVMQVETISKSTKSEIRSIKCSDIFKPLPGQTRPIRTVLMKGVAGIGKTFSVQKFILDWATGKDNQDFDFIFFLPFRELNLIESEISLQELVLYICPELKSSDNVLDGHKVLFIFDGLDESKHPFNFKTNQRWSDVKKQTSVDTLLTNLIKRNFSDDAFIWITSRPVAAGLIPSEHICRVTEVLGFEDQQKEEYIRKKCKNRALADRIISHIKMPGSLYMMCFVPVFCWIVVTLLEHTLEENSGESPRTLTDFYTNFLLFLLTAKEEKENVLKSHQEGILKLGKLAFESLEKNMIVFNDKDLKKCNIDLNNCSLYSGVFKEIFKQDSVLFQERVYSFLHLSVQEYFAALYVFGSYHNHNFNPLNKNDKTSTLKRKSKLTLNKNALKRAIQSRNGHLNLFVRFLLGMEMKNNQELLKGFLSHTQDHSSDIQETAGFIKKLIRETSSLERCINLFHCLSELKENSLIDEFNVTLYKVKRSRQRLSPSQCSALAYFSLLSEKEIDDFDMRKYATSEECVRILMPMAKITNTLRMERCKLTERCCEDLASVLQSQHSSLRKLYLCENNLGDSGVKLLSAALRDPNCKLTTLWMKRCKLTERCCEDLASVLQSQHSSLRDLFLSDNNLGDSGVKLLSAALRDPNCKLTELWMSWCKLTERCCEDLASALQSQHSSLRELDLGFNKLGDSGVKLLSAALRNPNCKLTTLRMWECGLTKRCCEDMASALQSQHSSLRDLDLKENSLGDSGVKLLSAALRNPNCKLTTLGMWRCELTERCCEDLASALQSQHSSLRKVNLCGNNLGDSGLKLLSAALKDPNCKLTTLDMRFCQLTERCCEDLADALQSQHSSLTELYLCGNSLGDSGVKLLSAAQRDPNCKLTTLKMRKCGLTERCCEDLASALQSQYSSLRDLDLSRNNLGDSGVNLLSAAQRDPNCKLTTLITEGCE